MKQRFFLIFLLTIVLLLATSCSEPEIQIGAEVIVEDEKPGEGGTINIGCIEPHNFNPLLVNSKSYKDISTLIFNGLVEYDSTLKPVYVLAEDLSLDEGGKKIIVKLKDNIQWSDGTKLTSQDVVFSLNTIKNAANSIYKSKLDQIVSYKSLDEYTIEMRFNDYPYNAIDSLCFPIVPKHVFEANPNSLPVGTGPYKVVAYNKLRYMELERNEYSLQHSTPYIPKIRVNFIKDTDSFDSSFQSGQIDLINTSSYDWEKYKESRDVNTYGYLSRDYEFISINFNNPVLQDKYVRKALMHGINRTAIIEKHLLGNAVITDTPIRADSWLFDGDVNKYSYNKAEAQYAISSARFVFNEAAGIYERESDGKLQQLRLSLITNSENDYRVKAVEDIKKNLEDIGFVINIEIMPFEELMKRIEKKQYDLALVGINFSPEADLYDFLHSSQVNGSKNYGGYINLRVDLLLEQSQNTLNPETKYLNYLELQRIIKDDLPIISLFYKEHALVMRNKIRGEIKVDSENLFRTISNWYINESLR